jgi:KaiC/GvpD/RAD55 family RecA-like ATPase
MEELEIEIKVLAALYNQKGIEELVQRRQTGLKLSFFLYPYTRRVAEETFTYLLSYGVLPNQEQLMYQLQNGTELSEIDQAGLAKTVNRVFADTTAGPFHFYRDQVKMNWMRHTAMNSLQTSVTHLEAGNIEAFTNELLSIPKAISKETDAMVRYDPIHADSERLVRGLLERRANPGATSYISTGIPWFDEKLDGGLLKGENYLGMGGSGRGKSFLSTHIGRHASWNAWRVVKFSLEMKAEKDVHRHLSAITGIPHSLFRKPHLMTDAQVTHLLATIKLWQERGCIYHVRSSKTRLTVGEIEAELTTLPFNPDLLIVDQMTDIASTLEWRDMALVARDLQLLAKSWNQEEGLAVVTFGQAKTSSEFQAVLTQDDFKYGRAPCEWSTCVFYLAATEEDVEDNILRLGMCKNRDNETPRGYARLYPNLEISRIHDPEREARETGSDDDGFPI